MVFSLRLGGMEFPLLSHSLAHVGAVVQSVGWQPSKQVVNVCNHCEAGLFQARLSLVSLCLSMSLP